MPPCLIAATGDAPHQPVRRDHSTCDGAREIVSFRNEMGDGDDRPIAQWCKTYHSVLNSGAGAGEDASASARPLEAPAGPAKPSLPISRYVVYEPTAQTAL